MANNDVLRKVSSVSGIPMTRQNGTGLKTELCSVQKIDGIYACRWKPSTRECKSGELLPKKGEKVVITVAPTESHESRPYVGMDGTVVSAGRTCEVKVNGNTVAVPAWVLVETAVLEAMCKEDAPLKPVKASNNTEVAEAEKATQEAEKVKQEAILAVEAQKQANVNVQTTKKSKGETVVKKQTLLNRIGVAGVGRNEQVRLTPAGVGIVAEDGRVLVFNKSTGGFEDALNVIETKFPLAFNMPIEHTKIKAGDLIVVNDTTRVITEVGKNHSHFMAVGLDNLEVKVLPTLNSYLKKQAVTKVVTLATGSMFEPDPTTGVMSPLGVMLTGGNVSDIVTPMLLSQAQDNPMGLMLPALLDGGATKEDMMALMAMGQDHTESNNMLPLLMMSMQGDMDMKEMLPLMLMNGQSGMDMNSMLPMMLMMGDGGSKDMMLPLLMMNQGGGDMNNMLPFLMMMNQGDGNKGDVMLPMMLMMNGGKDMNSMLPLLMMGDGGNKDMMLPLAMMMMNGQSGMDMNNMLPLLMMGGGDKNDMMLPMLLMMNQPKPVVTGAKEEEKINLDK